MSTDIDRIREIVRDWTQAVSSGDRAGILASHADDMLMFDFPSTVRGLEDYNRTWDFFFDAPRGPIIFEPSEITVTAGQDAAFATCEIHCDGTSAGPLDLRLTMGLQLRTGDWVITHEHHSVPTVEERFIGPTTAVH